MGLRSVLINIRKRGLKDILNPTKRKIFIRDYLENKYKWKILSEEEYAKLCECDKPDEAVKIIPKEELLSYAEQLVYRSCQCGDCLNLGNCKHCGCVVPDNMFDKENSCSAEKWGPMLSPTEWQDYKLSNKIFLKVENY